MNSIFVRYTVICALSFAISAPALADIPEPDEVRALGVKTEDWAAAAQGKIRSHIETQRTPDGKAAASGSAELVVRAPWQDCLEALYDHAALVKYMSDAKQIDVLTKEPSRLRVFTKASMLFVSVEYTIFLDFDRDAKFVQWKMDPEGKNSIRDTRGTWQFIPLADGSTFVRYTIYADSGMSLPLLIEDFAMNRSVPSTLEGFRNAAIARATPSK
jgi:hypothetical protein